MSFAHVYFNPEAREGRVERDALEALDEIRQANPDSAQLASWGDAVMLQSYYSDQTEQEVSALFGEAFAAAIATLDPGTWQGPIQSGYGIHLVHIIKRQDSRVPEWAEVRSRVLTDMAYEAGNAGKEQLFQEIAQRYQVVFDNDVRALMEAAGQ